MELDEMKLAWQQLDQRLSGQELLSRRIYRESQGDKLRHGLRPLVWGQSTQIAFGIGMMLWGIAFWSTHTSVLHALICGLAVQAFGLLMIAFAARILFLVQRIDYAAPVLEIQRRLAELRAWRVKVEAPLFSVLGSFIWIPIVLMLIQQAWDEDGVDYWSQLPGFTAQLMLSGVVSLVLVGLVYALLRRAGRLRWLENHFAGRSVQKAEAALEEIARFERD
ncbi:hypothetical protein [Dyella humicola]|uniref:hypothetical protein n=1 Tax=Dyella humicola TaxID=2992126 RepID=UPI002253BE99|nr:hypothetical protein [Dyella humicola]